MSRLGTESAFEVLVRARALEAQGHNVIHLEIGEPDFDTPRFICDAASQALKDGYTHYGPAAGLPELRQAIAEESAAVRGVKVDPAQVVVTPGAKPIMFFAILALVDEGDEVIYPDPGFPIYESMINFVGGKAVPIPLWEELDFRLDVNELRRLVTPRTKMLIVNSPQNPTGGVLTRDDLAAIADLCRERDIIVLSDEIYRRILYSGTHHSITAFDGMPQRTIILDGFSKTYAMTGWRLGYGIMPEQLAQQFARLQVNATSCTASFIQRAGVAALTEPQDEMRQFVEEFRRRRDLIVEGLNTIKGVTCKSPQGAFYVFPNVKSFGRSSHEIADLLLYEGHVATLSGTAFGKQGEGYLRLSYANSTDNLAEALRRMERTLGG
jgi:aspartate/methionine/tyrosine aminotransferase